MSQTYFGGYDMDRFDFIGFHDTRVQDIDLLSSELGIPLNPQVHENVTPPDATDTRTRLMADVAMMANLRKALSEDVEFYATQRARRSR
jgi:hypothetical protein